MDDLRKEDQVYEALGALQIPYTRHGHPAVYTVEEAERYWEGIEGTHCKNLFLRNKKGNHHYLLVAESRKKTDLGTLNGVLGEDRLSFASPARLAEHLGLTPGAVSPFGLLNNKDKSVIVIIDEDLKKSGLVNFHPNVNTATISLSFDDFRKYLDWCGNEVRYISL